MPASIVWGAVLAAATTSALAARPEAVAGTLLHGDSREDIMSWLGKVAETTPRPIILGFAGRAPARRLRRDPQAYRTLWPRVLDSAVLSFRLTPDEAAVALEDVGSDFCSIWVAGHRDGSWSVYASDRCGPLPDGLAVVDTVPPAARIVSVGDTLVVEHGPRLSVAHIPTSSTPLQVYGVGWSMWESFDSGTDLDVWVGQEVWASVDAEARVDAAAVLQVGPRLPGPLLVGLGPQVSAADPLEDAVHLAASVTLAPTLGGHLLPLTVRYLPDRHSAGRWAVTVGVQKERFE